MTTPVGQRTAPVPRTPPDPAPVTPPDDVSAIPMLPPTLKRSTSEACRAMSDAPPAAPASTTGATIAALTADGRASNGARHKRARGADAAAAAAAAAAASGVEGGRGVGTAQRYTDMTASPIVLALTQSVRKSNDRGYTAHQLATHAPSPTCKRHLSYTLCPAWSTLLAGRTFPK